MSSPVITLRWALQRNQLQYWTDERRERWQSQRLSEALRFAWERIPYYRDHWKQHDVGLTSAPNAADLARLPMLSRLDVQRHASELTPVATRAWGRRKVYSSGSTGPRVWVWHDAWSKMMENLARMRQRGACGLGPGAREAWLLSPRLYAESLERTLFQKVAVRNRFFVSLGEESRSQWEHLRALRPHAIQGFPGALESLADLLDEPNSCSLPSLRIIFSTGEVLTDAARTHVEKSFGVPVRDIYGSSEFGDIAWQCSRGNGYHVNTDLFHVELVDSDGCPGRAGRMVVTSLHNRVMPLVRYDTGDWAVASDASCECGRKLPILTSVSGRALDRLVLPSGRRVPPYRLVNGVVTPFVGRHIHVIRRFQVVQQSPAHVTLNFVAGADLPQDEIEGLRRDAMRALAEPMEVQISCVEELEAEPSGKTKRFLSKIQVDQPGREPDRSRSNASSHLGRAAALLSDIATSPGEPADP